jgi:polysaccharide biosynthesis transport protein
LTTPSRMAFYSEPLSPYKLRPAIPEQYAQPALGLAQTIAIMRHYWKASVAIATMVIGAATLAAFLLPKTFTATATLIVDYVNKDPLAGELLPLQLLASYVATQTELIDSPAVLLRVVDQLHLDSDPAFGGRSTTDPVSRREIAANALSRSLKVGEGRGGQLLYISVSARTAKRAAELANAVTDAYVEQDRARINDPAGERAKTYSKQLAELRQKVATAQASVTDFRAQKGLTGLSSATADLEVQTLNELEKHLVEAQVARRSVEANSLQSPAASNAARASNLVEALKHKLDTEDADIARLQSTFGAQHPRILELQSERAATRRSLDAELRSLSANGTEQLRSARDLEEKYRRAVEQQRKIVLSVRELQDEGAKLMLELESAQAVYKRALDGYDQVMFASIGNRTSVNVISRAVPPVKPSKPSKVKLIVGGAVVGIGLATLLPLLYELLVNRRMRCREDFERDFRVPVLAEFGAILARSAVS